MKLVKTLKNLSNAISLARNSRKSNIVSYNDVYQFRKESLDGRENKSLIQISIARES